MIVIMIVIVDSEWTRSIVEAGVIDIGIVIHLKILNQIKITGSVGICNEFWFVVGSAKIKPVIIIVVVNFQLTRFRYSTLTYCQLNTRDRPQP